MDMLFFSLMWFSKDWEHDFVEDRHNMEKPPKYSTEKEVMKYHPYNNRKRMNELNWGEPEEREHLWQYSM